MRNLVLTLAIVCLTATSVSAAEDPGISQTKPESGPYVKVEQGYMVPYEFTIPGTQVTLKMIPVPAGKVMLGSPESEEGHTDAEGPEVEVEVGPFWMAEHEMTWEQYKPYMELYNIFKKFQAKNIRPVTDDNRVDAITAPTPLYEPSFTFEYGEDPKLPATTMTNYAARQYTKWLSGVTGKQYRLPSEAEFEHAASGGAKTAYHFGDDAEQLGDYAWFDGNAEEKPHVVKGKKPNQYGLYDMHGNVWEWVLDQYSDEGFAKLDGKKNLTALAAVNWPTEVEPLMVKGGGWDEDAENCRTAAKMGSSEDDWKEEDPNIPLSPWWFTSYPSTCVGFRVVRPLEEVGKKDAVKFYQADIEFLNLDVSDRLIEGRGILGLVDPDLPEAIKKAD